ncbi:E3 SUMO-protein ligase ZBED1-like [Anastrepha obliqua]|uniref:E3 SUMO-protein ligase ZBED1-like n=1 Tax=Anastrepha obliqua TaxID=95512 RepID=UPI0024095386|nr:E3 SUMO-protein ligase ZBED1-like [Anastrepha obliqua]
MAPSILSMEPMECDKSMEIFRCRYIEFLFGSNTCRSTFILLEYPGSSSGKMDKFLTSSQKDHDTSPTSSNEPSCSKSEPEPKRKKCISAVWTHFDKLQTKQLVKCHYCGKEYKTSGNTSNLLEHLKRAHPLAQQVNNETTSSQLERYFTRTDVYGPTSSKKEAIDKAIAAMVATDLQPFSVVEDIGLRNLMRVVDPKYVMPCRKTLRDTYIKNMNESMTEKLKGILDSVDSCAITTDAWTSRANVSYLTVTCHFILNFELKTAVLSTKPLMDETNHSSLNIANTLREICDEWKVFDKLHTIVTDNAASMIKACELLKKKHLPCFAHTLNLVVQDALNLENVQNVLKITKRIVSYFKSSAIAYAKFKDAQGTENPCSLLQEVPTRWNSALQMIQRVLRTREPLTGTLLRCHNAPIPLSEDQFRILKDLSSLLEPFEKATKHASAAKGVTISLIAPAIFALSQSLEELHEQMLTPVGRETCEFLQSNVKKRLFSYENRSAPRLGTLLDPRFKKAGFQNPSNAQQAMLMLEGEVHNIIQDINKEHLFALGQCAIKFLCIPASSAESERTFSKTGAIVTERRA